MATVGVKEFNPLSYLLGAMLCTTRYMLSPIGWFH